MKINWLDIAKLVWSDKWEAVLGIAGLLISAATGSLPAWAAIISVVLALILAVDVVYAVRKTVRLTQEKHVPLLTIVGREREAARANAGEVLDVAAGLGFEPQRFRDEFGLEQDDWSLYQEKALDVAPSAWVDLCRRFLSNVQRLERLKGKKVFHVFHNGPAALAMGLGASLATRHLLILHHRQLGESELAYVPVMDFTTRGPDGLTALLRLRSQPPSPPQTITVHPPERWTAQVFVSLHLSTPTPEPDFSAMAATREAAFVAIRNQYGGVLPLEADWIQVAQEVANAVRAIRHQPGVQRMHLAFTCPVPLAFAIGMALGIQLPVRVYNWFADQKIYAPVIDLDKLRLLSAASLAALPPDVTEEAATPDWAPLTRLRRILVNHFDEGELATLCFDLGLDYEVLPGQGKANKARDLVMYLEHRGRIPELVERVRQSRPNVAWGNGGMA